MGAIIEYFISGKALLPGAAMLILAAALSFKHRKPLFRVLFFILAILGLIFIIASATPVSTFVFGLVSLSIISLYFFSPLEARNTRVAFIIFRVTLAICAIHILLSEAAYRRMPPPTSPPPRKIYILGSGLSLNPGARAYADFLRDDHALNVFNLSRDGNTPAAALSQAGLIGSPDIMVIIELGCDLSFHEFADSIEPLVATLRKHDIPVAMFELPKISSAGNYVRLQRELAAKYRFALIPRQVLANAIHLHGKRDPGRLNESAHRAIAAYLGQWLKGGKE